MPRRLAATRVRCTTRFSRVRIASSCLPASTRYPSARSLPRSCVGHHPSTSPGRSTWGGKSVARHLPWAANPDPPDLIRRGGLAGMVADVDLHAVERTPHGVALDTIGRGIVERDRSRFRRGVRLTQRNAEPLEKGVEQRGRDGDRHDADPRHDRRRRENTARQRVDEVTRGAPALKDRLGEGRERQAVIARIEQAERSAEEHRGEEVGEALGVGAATPP